MSVLTFILGLLCGGAGALVLADALDWLGRIGESD